MEAKHKKVIRILFFSDLLSLSCNPKHFINTQESLKLIEEIIVRYLKKEREKLIIRIKSQGIIDHRCIHVFSGQTSDPVLAKPKENYIKHVCVPKNMIQIFQLLDLNVYGSVS